MGDPCSKWEALILTAAGCSCFVSAEEPDWLSVQEREGWARLSFRQGEHGGTRGWGMAWAEPPGLSLPPSLPCASPVQDQRILLSIYNISMSLREVGPGTLQGPEELAVWRVARNTNTVLRENCRKISKVGNPLLPSHVSGSQFPGLWAELALFVLSWLPMRSLQALPASFWELGNADGTSIHRSFRITKRGRFTCGSVGQAGGVLPWAPKWVFPHVPRCHG